MSDAPPDPMPPPRFDRSLAVQWTAVFISNLPVPVFLALAVTSGKGVAGLITGLVLLYWIGFVVCAGRFRVGRSLLWGGVAVGIAQIFPVLQMGAGSVGMSVWERMTGHSFERQTFSAPPTPTSFSTTTAPTPPPERETMNNLGMFVVVLLTAQPMCMIAVLIGAFIRWLQRDFPIWRNPPADPDKEPTENPAS